MITIVCSSINPDSNFKNYVIRSGGLPENKIQFLHYENKGKYGLTELYNKALSEAENEIVIFMHDDIEFKKNNWVNKLIKHFKRNPDYGVIGVAGSKEMPESGKWWETPSKMYGRVYHTQNGKTWLSEYSEDLGSNLEEVTLVDGVFFSVHTGRIKKKFNEDVKGFHFYDVDFSFSNHLAGVKVGVCTDVKINHMSIGATNEQWDENRKDFVNRYSNVLPRKISEDFSNKKLKLLIGCLNFNGLTGSEISTMELAKELSKNNCEVTVVSNVGSKFATIAKRYGIKTCSINEPPGFKLGDGKWTINRGGKVEVSKQGMLYQVSNVNFDVIHANHTPITQRLLQLYPKTPILNIVRSEVIDLENPVIHNNIKQYVAIRPSIKDYIVDNFNVSENNVETIYNFFDKGRFTNKSLDKGTDKEVILFAGTMDYLRKESILDLINTSNSDEQEIWLLGKDTLGYGIELSNTYDNVRYFPPTENIEEFYYKCDKTAGILLGRTTIEGFLCGRPGIIYQVDKEGKMLSKETMEVPKDMSIFDNNKNVLKYKELYIKTYNK